MVENSYKYLFPYEKISGGSNIINVPGNLISDSYEEILNGEEMNKVKAGLLGNEKISILCRHCSCANECL